VQRDFIDALPVNSVIHPAGRPINTSTIGVLRRPVETAQYTSIDYTQTIDDHGVLHSIGTVGDAYDNATAESFVDSFKTELIADHTWTSRSQLELAIVEYVARFNDTRLHESLGDRPPREIEDLYAVKVRPTRQAA
jgi:transposase InsO family protein